MISSSKLWLVLLVAACAVAAAEDTESFVCASICGNQKKGLSTPDFVVEYNWNSRIPVCSGLSCETGTCSELQLKLPSYSGQADCLKHQTGLQEAGCECKGAKSSANNVSLPMGTMLAVLIGVITLLLWAGEMEKPTKFIYLVDEHRWKENSFDKSQNFNQPHLLISYRDWSICTSLGHCYGSNWWHFAIFERFCC